LEVFPENSVVNIESLVKYGIVDAKDAKTYGVKILGDGEVTRKLTVELPTSKSASEKITKKGGKVLSSSSAK